MDFGSVGLSALVGGIAGLVSYFLVYKFIARKFNLSSRAAGLISVILTVTGITVHTSFNQGSGRAQKQLKQIEASLEEANQIVPIFQFIREIDPVQYEKFKTKLAEISTENPSITDEAMASKAHELGAALSARYYRQASDQALSDYANEYVKFAAALTKSNPAVMCKWQLPHVFGSLSMNDWRDSPDKTQWMSALKVAIQSGAKMEFKGKNSQAKGYRDKFHEDFAKKYPAAAASFGNPGTYRSETGFPVMANGLLRYYSEINLLPKATRIAVWRLTLGGPE